MNTRLISAVFLIGMTLAAVNAHAAVEIAPEGTPIRKLQRGFLNIALSPIEISNEMASEKKRDTFPPSWVLGAGRGSFFAVGRALVGAFEILTFPASMPAHYGPVLEPEFPWQHLPELKDETTKKK